MANSGTTEHMMRDPIGLEDNEPTPAGQCIEGAGGTHLPVAGYGRLCLLVDQRDGNLQGSEA